MRNRGSNSLATFLFFAIFAAALIYMASLTLQADRAKDVYTKTDATVTAVVLVPAESSDDRNEYDVDFTYVANGDTYSAMLDNTTICYNVGDTFELFFNPDDPSLYVTGDTSFGIYILIAGIISAIISLLALARRLINGR